MRTKKVEAMITGELTLDKIKYYVASVKGDGRFVFPIKKDHPLNINDKVNLLVHSLPKRGIIGLVNVNVGNKRYYTGEYQNY